MKQDNEINYCHTISVEKAKMIQEVMEKAKSMPIQSYNKSTNIPTLHYAVQAIIQDSSKTLAQIMNDGNLLYFQTLALLSDCKNLLQDQYPDIGNAQVHPGYCTFLMTLEQIRTACKRTDEIIREHEQNSQKKKEKKSKKRKANTSRSKKKASASSMTQKERKEKEEVKDDSLTELAENMEKKDATRYLLIMIDQQLQKITHQHDDIKDIEILLSNERNQICIQTVILKKDREKLKCFEKEVLRDKLEINVQGFMRKEDHKSGLVSYQLGGTETQKWITRAGKKIIQKKGSDLKERVASYTRTKFKNYIQKEEASVLRYLKKIKKTREIIITLIEFIKTQNNSDRNGFHPPTLTRKTKYGKKIDRNSLLLYPYNSGDKQYTSASLIDSVRTRSNGYILTVPTVFKTGHLLNRNITRSFLMSSPKHSPTIIKIHFYKAKADDSSEVEQTPPIKENELNIQIKVIAEAIDIRFSYCIQTKEGKKRALLSIHMKDLSLLQEIDYLFEIIKRWIRDPKIKQFSQTYCLENSWQSIRTIENKGNVDTLAVGFFSLLITHFMQPALLCNSQPSALQIQVLNESFFPFLNSGVNIKYICINQTLSDIIADKTGIKIDIQDFAEIEQQVAKDETLGLTFSELFYEEPPKIEKHEKDTTIDLKVESVGCEKKKKEDKREDSLSSNSERERSLSDSLPSRERKDEKKPSEKKEERPSQQQDLTQNKQFDQNKVTIFYHQERQEECPGSDMEISPPPPRASR